jgi:hypothetical protein
VSGFPPDDIRGFLESCAGEWLALRSRFDLDGAVSGAEIDDDNWHESERGELLVAYLEPEDPGAPGGLTITPPGAASQSLMFRPEGTFHSEEQEGRWELWPDGSLELMLRDGSREIRERIWFTKPNLRLRSSVEHRVDGAPGRASFSSEIRRLSRAAAPPAAG